MFTAATTQASALAYALARFYRARGATTVIGGPHAKGFTEDSVRFYDIVVKQSDEALIGDILGGFDSHDPNFGIRMDDALACLERACLGSTKPLSDAMFVGGCLPLAWSPGARSARSLAREA